MMSLGAFGLAVRAGHGSVFRTGDPLIGRLTVGELAMTYAIGTWHTDWEHRLPAPHGRMSDVDLPKGTLDRPDLGNWGLAFIRR